MVHTYESLIDELRARFAAEMTAFLVVLGEKGYLVWNCTLDEIEKAVEEYISERSIQPRRRGGYRSYS